MSRSRASSCARGTGPGVPSGYVRGGSCGRVSESTVRGGQVRSYSSKLRGTKSASSSVSGGDSTWRRGSWGTAEPLSLSCCAGDDEVQANRPMTGDSIGRGFRRTWTATGMGWEEVCDWKEAKDWMASEGRAEGFTRACDGAPSVDAWERCIVLVISPQWAWCCTTRTTLRRLSIANVGGRCKRGRCYRARLMDRRTAL
jgi:hypothetical protein